MASESWKKAINGDWSTVTNWTPLKVPGAADDVTIGLTGAFTVTISNAQAAHSLTLNSAGATLADAGTLLLGTSLSIASGAFALEAGGMVRGGTISTGAAGTFVARGGTLSGVTFRGPLDLSAATSGAEGSLAISNGVRLTGANGSGPGSINLAGSYAGTLAVVSPMTLDNATIAIGGRHNSYLLFDNRSGAGGVTTLGGALTITQSGFGAVIQNFSSAAGDALVSQGTINASYFGGFLDIIGTEKFTNQGSILAGNVEEVRLKQNSCTNSGLLDVTGGASAYIYANGTHGGTFTNTGTVSVSGSFGVKGSKLVIGEPSFVNSGLITVTGGGRLDVGVTPGMWSNTGTISETGGTVLLGGTFSRAIFDSIRHTGGTLGIYGALLNAGATLSVGRGSSLGTVEVGLYGTIIGGSIHDSGGGLDSGWLSDVVYQGTLNGGFKTSSSYEWLRIANGITLTGANGSGPGAINLSGTHSGLLQFVSPTTLDNAVITTGGSPGSRLDFYNHSGTGGVTTLGSILTISQTGATSFISNTYGSAGDGLVNNGTISAGFAGGYLALQGNDPFTNQGSLLVSNGERLKLDEYSFTNAGLLGVSGGARFAVIKDPLSTHLYTFTNSGTISVAGGSTLSFQTTLTNLAGTGLTGGTIIVGNGSTIQLSDNSFVVTDAAGITLSGAGSVIQSLDTATGKQAALDSTLATIASTGTLALAGGRAFKATARGGTFADNGLLRLAGGSFAATSLLIGAGGKLSGVGSVVGNVTDSGALAAAGGTLAITGAVRGSGNIAIGPGAEISITGSLVAIGTLSFTGGGGTLALGTPGKATTQLAGFGAGDTIDILNTSVTRAAWTQLSSARGTLLLAGATGTIGSLALDGAFKQANFKLAGDGHGGTNITFAAALTRDALNLPARLAAAGMDPAAASGGQASDFTVALEHLLLADPRHA